MPKENTPEHTPEEEISIGQAFGKGYTLAINLVVSSLLCMAFGYWLDTVWGTTPLCMIFGLFLGFGAGVYQMIKQTLQAENKPSSSPHEKK